MTTLFVFVLLVLILFTISTFVKDKFRLNDCLLSIPIIILLFLLYGIILFTKNLKLGYVIFILISGLMLLVSLFYIIKLILTSRENLFIDFKLFLLCLISTLVIYLFSIQYLPQFVTLVPLSESANQISLVQNIYFDNDLINIDRTINILPIVFGYMLKILPSLTEISLPITYFNLLILLFIFLIIDLIVKTWKRNNHFAKNSNIGVILFVGLIFTLASLKLSYLSSFWLIFPISNCFFYLYSNNTSNSHLLIILLLINAFSCFVFGLDFNFSIVLSLTLIFSIMLNYFYNKKIIQRYSRNIICVIFLIYIISLIVYQFNGYSIIKFFRDIGTSNGQSAYNPILDLTTSSWLLNLYIAFYILFVIVNYKMNVSSKLAIVIVIFLLVFNPYINLLINNSVESNIYLCLLFNPIVLSWLFEKHRENYSYNNSVVFFVSLVMVVVSNKFLINPYYSGESELYDKSARIEKQELEIYNVLNQVKGENVIRVVSQAPFTKVYVPGVILLDEFRVMMNRCQYCDVESLQIHQPNALVNIFSYREFSGNRLFVEEPEYDSAVTLLLENNYSFLILRNDQIINYKGDWITLIELLQDTYKVIYTNETYSLLTI